jgi:hypothetical protein
LAQVATTFQVLNNSLGVVVVDLMSILHESSKEENERFQFSWGLNKGLFLKLNRPTANTNPLGLSQG